MEHIRNFLGGAASIFGAFAPRQYDIPKRGGFARDAANLRGDWKRVGDGLQRQIDKQAQRPSKATTHG